MANNTKIKKTEEEFIALSQQTRLPSPSAAVNENSRFKSADEEEGQGRKPKGGTTFALHFQKIRRVSESKTDIVLCNSEMKRRRDG